MRHLPNLDTVDDIERGAWPPAALMLPATDEAIERGRPKAARPEPDDSREARLQRLLGDPSPQRARR